MENEEQSDELVQRFENWLAQSQLYTDLQTATGRFLSEYATFDAFHVTVLLRAVSWDPIFIKHLTELMTLEHRLQLLERLMKERGAPREIVAEIKAVLEEGRKLKAKRNEIAHARAAFATVSFQGSAPGEPIPGIRRSRLETPAIPAGGFTSQTHMEQYMRRCMHTVPEIDRYYDRAIRLNRRAAKAGSNLRKAMGLGEPPPRSARQAQSDPRNPAREAPDAPRRK